MRRRRMTVVRWLGVGAALAAIAVVIGAFAIGIVGVPRATGYFAPVFAPDGRSVFAVVRDVRATITGFGQQMFTPPATVRLHRDRFRLVNVRLSDGAITIVEEFPPSPLEGSRFEAYHGAIFGAPHARLRWADAEHLEYEIGVTRNDTPFARTFVVRRTWDPRARAHVTTAPWEEGPTTMSGGEASRLHADSEVIAVPGDEMMPCAIAVLESRGATARALIGGACGARYPAGLTAEALAPFSRRADIERAKHVERTYAELAARGRAAGLSEVEALLRAGEEMSRLGLFPKSTTLTAERTACAAVRAFDISDDELAAGLFPDIERAIAAPGTEVEKSMGQYITHRDYRTSREIDEWLDAGRDEFPVRVRGECWRMTIRRP